MCPWHPLHLSRVLYKSTLFMQNKANFRRAKMNVGSLITKDYENIANWTLGQNEPNTNPNEPNSKACPPSVWRANLPKDQMNVNKVLTKDYDKKTLGEHGKNEPKTNPIKANTNPIKANIMPKQTQYEPNQTQTKPVLSAVEWANFRLSLCL